MPSGTVDEEQRDEIAQHARLQARGYVTRSMFDGPRAVFRAVGGAVEDPPQD